MHKFHSKVLIQHIMQFAQFFKASIDNLRSGISKNAMMFTTELFANKEITNAKENTETMIKFVKVTMPSLVFKTVYEKAFIAKEAKASVTNALEWCTFDDMLTILISKGCNGNNRTLQENGYVYCGLFVKKAKPEYFANALDKDKNEAIV